MSFHRVAGFLLFIFIMITAALPARGQMGRDARTTYTIAGTVSDDNDEHRLAEVRVALTTQSDESVSTMTMTDGSGRFELNGIPPGNYVLHITSAGYEPTDDLITLVNSTMHGLNYSLRRTAGAPKTSPEALVSAHELAVPGKAHDEYEKGVALLYSKSDYQGALVQFQRAIKDYPTFYEAYAKQGTAYIALRQIPDAEKSFRESVELSAEKYPEALFLLAGLLNGSNRSAEAEPLCRKGLAIDGSSALGHFELGRALVALNKPDEAEKNMVQSRDLRPDNFQVYLFLANIHIQKHDYPAALKDLNDYLQFDSSSPTADQARKTQAALEAVVPKNLQPPPSTAAQQAKQQAKAKKQAVAVPDDQEGGDLGDSNPSWAPSIGQ